MLSSPAFILSSILLTYVPVAVRRGAHAFSPRPSLYRTRNRGIHKQGRVVCVVPTSVLKSSSGEDKETEEWRAFRARLVQNGLPSLMDDKADIDASGAPPVTTPDGRFAHESTPLVEVGTILLSIPTTDLCQALEQQYWHRSVVLITAVSQDTVKGDVETVPDEQLAQGAKRGRWSYRGLLLNRCTDLVFESANVKENESNNKEISEEQQKKCSEGGGWNIQRGGDLLGLDSSDGHTRTEFTCLHHLDRTDPNVREVSMNTNLIADFSMMSLGDAQTLCRNHNKFSPDDFYAFGGFCSWRPGQLEIEMGEERREWLALSVDANSILEEMQMQRQAYDSNIRMKDNKRGHNENVARRLLEFGTDMWRNFLAMIEISESRATERLPAGQLNFYDRMLEIWAEENLSDCDDAGVPVAVNDSTYQIGPGTLVRAKSHVSNDMLLFDKEFIRSLVLVLEETSDATIGIILNHPLAGAIECLEGEDPLPLRYGGPIEALEWKDGTFHEDDFDGPEEQEDDMYEGFEDYLHNARDFEFDNEDNSEDDDDEDNSPFIWIHRDAALGSRGPDGRGGSQLGTSGLWVIKEDDALASLQTGFLCLKDTMVFSGVCIWEKDPDLGICGGGLREQIDSIQSFEVVRACTDQCDNDAIESVWDILIKRQNVLVKESFESNIDAAVDAWEICTSKMDQPIASQMSPRVGLSDAALRAWLGVNLLGDPLGTFVEVRNEDQKRELRGQ